MAAEANLRKALREELAACAADPTRDTCELSSLLDQHAVMRDFDPLADGVTENNVIQFLAWRS